MNRKKMAAAAITASLVGGGTAAAVLTGLPAAFAQSSDSTAPANSWVGDALAELVTNGTITQAQADAVGLALADAKPDFRGHGGRGGGGPVRLDAVAEVIGIDADALRQALMDGQTVAEVAAANGVSVETVVDALLANLETHLAEHVAEGDKTQEEADAILAEAPGRITAAVNGEAPLGGHRGPGGSRLTPSSLTS